MNRLPLIVAFVAILMASCSTPDSTNSDSGKISACDCAKLINAENVDADKAAKCKELRTDEVFDKD
ncbi:MAG: hypothetical protein ACPGED_08260, partial [Flavobacteriales bacterium]